MEERDVTRAAFRAAPGLDLVLEALDMAIWRRGQMRSAGAIHHSDRGSQYTSFAFTRRLASEGLVGSMGTVGDALDRILQEEVEHLPVIDNNHLVGICTRTDIMRARRAQWQNEQTQPGWRPHRPRRGTK